MAHQDALTLIAEVDPQRVVALEPVLAAMRADPGDNPVLPFGKLPGCHFGRVLLLPATVDLEGDAIAPQLLVMIDCDGPAAAHLDALVDVAGDGIDRLFGACSGYPGLPATREQRRQFLRQHVQKPRANYVHRQGRTVEQIRGEAQLREALERLVGKNGFGDLPAVEVRKRIRATLANDVALSWALEPAPGEDLAYRTRNALHLFTLPLGLFVFGPVVIPAALLAVVLVRLQEERDPAPHLRPSAEHLEELLEIEDRFAHSGYSAGGFVKPNPLRRGVVRAVVPLIGWGTRHLFTRDSLAGVKTIHFARWVPLDGGRRVVFCSNFDGSVESYNNDFIDLVSWGLNLVFSNGYGYPRTRWLVFGGATREQEFKDYLRRHQIPTPIWYSAYPELTAVNIERNAKLRAGLHGRMNEKEAQAWLRLL